MKLNGILECKMSVGKARTVPNRPGRVVLEGKLVLPLGRACLIGSWSSIPERLPGRCLRRSHHPVARLSRGWFYIKVRNCNLFLPRPLVLCDVISVVAGFMVRWHEARARLSLQCCVTSSV